MFGAQWRTMEAKIVEKPPLAGHMPGYDVGHDISPHAGEAEYDDSLWPKIEAEDLSAQRGAGYVVRRAVNGPTWRYLTNVEFQVLVRDFESSRAPRSSRTLPIESVLVIYSEASKPDHRKKN